MLGTSLLLGRLGSNNVRIELRIETVGVPVQDILVFILTQTDVLIFICRTVIV